MDRRIQLSEPEQGFTATPDDESLKLFAERHGLSPAEVRDLIREHGRDRDSLEAAILKRRQP